MMASEISSNLILLVLSLSASWACKDFKLSSCTCETRKGNGQFNIRCRSGEFSTIPTNLPKNTWDLTILSSSISTLSLDSFSGVPKLRFLNLDGNSIKNVDFAVFEPLKHLENLSIKRSSIQRISNSKPNLKFNKLKTVSFDSNSIQEIKAFTFPDLPKLIQLSFKANGITSIDSMAFQEIRRNAIIILENNPLNCSCEMKKFRDWTVQRDITLQNAVCQDGIELPRKSDFGSCGSDDSDEGLTCYSCTNVLSTDECQAEEMCDFGQDLCMTKIKTVDGVTLYSKMCASFEQCQGLDSSNTDVNKIDLRCCSGNRCNTGGGSEEKLFCEEEKTRTEKGNFIWSKSEAPSTFIHPCPGDKSISITRECVVMDGLTGWEDFDDAICPEASDITEELAIILDTPITKENIGGLSARLQNVSERCPEYGPMDVDHTVSIVKRFLHFGSGQQGRETVSNCVGTFSNIFKVPLSSLEMAEQRYKSAQRYLETMEGFGSSINLNGIDMVKEVRRNLAIVAVSIDQSTFNSLKLEASPDLSSDGSVITDGTVEDDPSQTDILELPNTLFSGLNDRPVGEVDQASFVIYQTDTIFKTVETINNSSESMGNRTKTTLINSRILAATVGDLKVNNLKDPVLITLRHLRKNYSRPQCVYWDFTLNTWSDEGCSVKETVNGSHTVCECYHLTNFALLMDVYGDSTQQGSQQAIEALTFISVIGCTISFFGLVLTIVIYSLFSKLRKDVPSKILMNLCVALACLNVCFIIGVYSLETPALCKAIAVLLHYFLLSSMAWMSVEAFYMYLALVLVFRTYFQRFMLKAMLVAWGVPLVIVAITLGVNQTENYGLQSDNQICWLTRIPFYASALAPVALVMLANIIIFAMVIKQICGMSAQKLNKSETVTAMQQFRGIIGVFILLGVTWIFAFLAIGEASLAFQYLFTIFNAFQGLFIFIFYCLMKRDVQKRLFCCCSSSQDPSTSSQKSSKGTYSTSGRVKASLRSAVNSILPTNIKKRGSSGPLSGTGYDEQRVSRDDEQRVRGPLNGPGDDKRRISSTFI